MNKWYINFAKEKPRSGEIKLIRLEALKSNLRFRVLWKREQGQNRHTNKQKTLPTGRHIPCLISSREFCISCFIHLWKHKRPGLSLEHRRVFRHRPPQINFKGRLAFWDIGITLLIRNHMVTGLPVHVRDSPTGTRSSVHNIIDTATTERNSKFAQI